MYSVVHANPAYVLLAALDLLSGCEIRNSSGTFVSSPNFCQFTQLLSVFPTYSSRGLLMCFVPTWAVLTGWLWHVPTRFYGLKSIFVPWDFEGFLFFFDTPDNTSLFKIEESIIFWDHPRSLCQFSHRTKTIRTIKFPLQLYSVHHSAGGKTGTVICLLKYSFSESKSAGFKL